MRLTVSRITKVVLIKSSRLNRLPRIDGTVEGPLKRIMDSNSLPDFTSPQGRAAAKLLTQWNARFAARYGFPLLSEQGRLLMELAERVSMPLAQAQICLPLPNRTFFNRIAGMKDAGLLIVETDPADGRLRRLRLGSAFGSKSDDP